ncbi:caspase-14 [Phascolarctos cinereus]|uniref:Caspase-14 n=1 Tax=Phascolarctos cinereus TaxID=38626 RepID=A0A6P5J230_PHACI|nr:caspase-14 [Phascolarctos cinereus]XP_020824939.1 caspase-14 [Phascolarctos cinereus]
MSSEDQQSTDQDAYDMSDARLALTLCNTKNRAGSETDVKALEQMYEALGFKSTVRRNLSAKGFWEELDKFRKDMDQMKDPVSCCFVVLMAHGEEGILLGIDDNTIQLSELFSMLTNENCQALRGKPKVFIVQACRGDQKDAGEVVQPAETGGTFVLSEEHPPKLPTYTDTLHVFATVEGHIAYRHVEDGSFFIQTLTDVFTNMEGHILDLLTEVTRLMADAELMEEGKPRKVNPEVQSTLRKLLYLQ